jgi:hypothetical protein
MTPVEELTTQLDAARQRVAELESALRVAKSAAVDLDDTDSVGARAGDLYNVLVLHEPGRDNGWIDIDDRYVDSLIRDQIPCPEWIAYESRLTRAVEGTGHFIGQCNNLQTLWCIRDLLEKAVEFAYHGPAGPRCILGWSCEWDSEKREFIYTGANDDDED